MSTTVTVRELPLEDKVAAAEMRQATLLPALARGEQVTFDFGGMGMVTQGWMHSLFVEAMLLHGEDVLERLTFKNCNETVRAVVGLVVDYTLDNLERRDNDRDADSRHEG